MNCITEQDLNEMNIEIIRSTLYKEYLESFYKFCQELGGATADVMCDILAVWPGNPPTTTFHVSPQFEADRRAFNITINSFGTELTRDVRAKLYPTCGKLFPEGVAKLAECSDIAEVQRIAALVQKAFA